MSEVDGYWEKSIIDAGYKALAIKHHPDKGGKDDDFKALLAAKNRLIAWVDYALARGFAGAAADRTVAVPRAPAPRVRTPEEIIDAVIDIAQEIFKGRRRHRRRPRPS